MRNVAINISVSLFVGALAFLFQNCSTPMAVDDSSVASSASSAIQLLSYPADQTVIAGSTVVLSASAYSATGDGLTYQWFKNSVVISGATASSLTLSAVTAADSGTYALRVSDGTYKVYTPSFYVQVGTSSSGTITIATQPLAQSVSVGGVAHFEVVATDASNAVLYYQWYKNGVALSGATASEMFLSGITSTDAAYYSVTVSNGAASLKSNTVLLTVVSAAASCTNGTLYNSHCYIYYTSTKTWTAAQSTCDSLGGYLVSISSSSENYFVYSLTKASVWIGASDQASEGTFYWTNGSALTFTAWNSGEPNASTSGEDCVEMTSTGYWNDNSCSTVLKGFVCELE
ncbi:MAG: hypothetical protein IPJ84_10025 [Bdellovibrionales bacterium]|nr:hypothetical protein [Bdellovibrionales bacterium]